MEVGKNIKSAVEGSGKDLVAHLGSFTYFLDRLLFLAY